ncbi:heat stress transcription factor B-4-like [Rhododendron vialii]|uniref:heat stress transcription factor B-4-like n=1 Tax=Rhododendron vialii TaxID=182163 RepID=UPI00265E15CF|nr:heat stress transcription factor B-4-like [Rhododendron vialii]
MSLMLDNCESILLSLDPQQHKSSVPAPFLTKTYHLIDDPATDHIVSWGEDDATFVVWRPPEFARDLLPNYFKHNNFSSFVRQLNTYGFRKIVPDRWEFANEFFKKGEKQLLCEIHRRKTSSPTQIAANHHHQYPHSPTAFSPTFYNYPTQFSTSPPDSSEEWSDSPPFTATNGISCYNTTTTTSATALSEENERLRRSNNMLMSEIAHMRKLYNDIIYFVQNHVKPVAPSRSTSFLVAAPPRVQKYDQVQGTGRSFDYYSGGGELTVGDDEMGTKLFGVNLQSKKKRLHADEYCSSDLEISKARLVLEKDDLGLNLMPPSPR